MGRSERKTGRKETRIKQTDRFKFGFGELREKLNDFEEDKIWKANEEAERQAEVAQQLAPILEGETENSSEAEIASSFGNGGGPSNLL